MSKAIYVGVDNKARKAPKLYVGVNGVARRVVKGYVGVNGVARLFYEAVPPEPEVGFVSALTLRNPSQHYDEVLRYYTPFRNYKEFAVTYHFAEPVPGPNKADTISGALFSAVVPNSQILTVSLERDPATKEFFLQLERYFFSNAEPIVHRFSSIPAGYEGEFNISWYGSQMYTTWGNYAVGLPDVIGEDSYYGFLESPRIYKNANVLLRSIKDNNTSGASHVFYPYKFSDSLCGYKERSGLTADTFYSSKLKPVMLE